MKGERAEYYINFERAFMFPRPKRVRKALTETKRFVTKHTRAKDISISGEVNEFIHKNSKNIPRGMGAVLYREEGKVSVFLQKGTGLDVYIKARAEEKKKKEAAKKKDEKTEKKEGKEEAGKKAWAGKETEAKEEAEADAEKKRLLDEKRIKEGAGAAIGKKRG